MLTDFVILVLLSDQFYKWSDENSRRTCCRASETTQCSGASAAAASIDPPRFTHRAIQALWQAGMQVRRWSGSWSQVLPLGQLSGPTATDGLCATGAHRAGRGVAGQLSSGTRNPGRNLRDQPRVAAPPRGALTRCHECMPNSLRCWDRLETGRRTYCQYAGRLARRAAAAWVPSCGGRR